MTERYEVKNTRGERLAVAVHGQLGGECAAVMCHGMLSTKDSPKHVRVAESMASLGIPAVRFDFAGRGESEGSLFEMTYTRELEDLQSIIEWLATNGVRRVGLFGSSMGGAIALLAAARDERVVAVATVAAVAHPGALVDRYPSHVAAWRRDGYVDTDEGRIGAAFLDDAAGHDVVWAASVLLAPVLVIHGTEDEIIPLSDAHDLACAARRARLIEVDDADHRLTRREHVDEMVDLVSVFLGGELSSDVLPASRSRPC
ncbi:MAG: alpha/beta fold hydrolase [Myxococcota bacterium]